MALIATRLSTRVEAGFSVAPQYKTSVRALRSGHESRNADWATPLRRFSASFAAFNDAERAELIGCHTAALGQLHTFLFRDWLDYRAQGVSLGVAPSGSTPVQLVKPSTWGGSTTTRTILHPVAATVVVYQNGVVKAGTVSALTGLFTPTTGWTAGQPLTADFDFDVAVRFATDMAAFTMPHREIAELAVELIEVRE